MTRGIEQTKKDQADYDLNPDDYRSGARKFQANSRIYGAKSVKNALLRVQYDKCCYCESKFRPTSYGNVEHYRPKGTIKQAPGWDNEYPGYYWLAYTWDNLLVSCSVCNTSYKGILFPLLDNTTRAHNHHDDIEYEQPLFINPAEEDPRQHIRFRGNVPVPYQGSEFGRATIEGLGLRRSKLDEARRKELGILRTFRDIVKHFRDSTDPDERATVEKAQEYLTAAIDPKAQYSSMAQDFLNDESTVNLR